VLAATISNPSSTLTRYDAGSSGAKGDEGGEEEGEEVVVICVDLVNEE